MGLETTDESGPKAEPEVFENQTYSPYGGWGPQQWPGGRTTYSDRHGYAAQLLNMSASMLAIAEHPTSIHRRTFSQLSVQQQRAVSNHTIPHHTTRHNTAPHRTTIPHQTNNATARSHHATDRTRTPNQIQRLG